MGEPATQSPIELLVRPKYPGEFGDIEELLPVLRHALSDEARVVRMEPTPQAGFGVTGFEILQIWVLSTAGLMVSAAATAAAVRVGQRAVDETVDWLKRRATSNARAASVQLRGPDGAVIRSVVVKNRQVVQETTEEDKRDDLMQIPPPTRGRYP